MDPFSTRTSRRHILTLGGTLAAMCASRLPIAVAAEAIAPADILARADDVRSPAEGYLAHLLLDSTDSPGEPWELEVSSRSNRQCVVKTLKPAREKGRAMLMVDEDMWAYLPNLKRSIRVAMNQKLVGQAANGDITRTRWSGDYGATIEAETDHDWRVLLTAAKKGLTYEKIRAWIEKGTFRPVKAECLSLAGRPLKTITYGKYRELCGKQRPTELVIADAVRTQSTSVLHVVSMELRRFPDSMFTPEALQ